MVTVTISIPFELFLETFPTYGLIVLVDKFDTFSYRKKEDKYVIVTYRWQKFSDVYGDEEVLHFFANYVDEFWFMVWMLKGKKSPNYIYYAMQNALIDSSYAIEVIFRD